LLPKKTYLLVGFLISAPFVRGKAGVVIRFPRSIAQAYSGRAGQLKGCVLAVVQLRGWEPIARQFDCRQRQDEVADVAAADDENPIQLSTG
jgi:hypothetical protein